MKQTTKAHLAVLGTNLFFAANFSFVKMVSPSPVKPFGLNIFRVGISLVLFWALWLFSASRQVLIEKILDAFYCADLQALLSIKCFSSKD